MKKKYIFQTSKVSKFEYAGAKVRIPPPGPSDDDDDNDDGEEGGGEEGGR